MATAVVDLPGLGELAYVEFASVEEMLSYAKHLETWGERGGYLTHEDHTFLMKVKELAMNTVPTTVNFWFPRTSAPTPFTLKWVKNAYSLDASLTGEVVNPVTQKTSTVEIPLGFYFLFNNKLSEGFNLHSLFWMTKPDIQWMFDALVGKPLVDAGWLTYRASSSIYEVTEEFEKLLLETSRQVYYNMSGAAALTPEEEYAIQEEIDAVSRATYAEDVRRHEENF